MQQGSCYMQKTLSNCPYNAIDCWHCASSGGCGGQNDNDVAGVGVLIAFFATALITLLLAWVDYLPGGLEDRDRNKILDISFRKWIWSCFRREPSLHSNWKQVTHQTILMMSDQLLVTGLTILVAALAQSKTMSIYNFNMAIWLAWLASNAHQVTLGVLKDYLRNHHTVLWYRLAAMSTIYVLLLASTALSGMSTIITNNTYKYAFDAPVRCTWNLKNLRSMSADTIFSLCVLTVSFGSQVLRLFVTPSALLKEYLRHKPGLWLKRKYRAIANNPSPARSIIRCWFNLKLFVLFVVYITARALFDTYTSDLFEFLWLTLSLAYGSAEVFIWRGYASGLFDQDSWSFGQLLAPLSLLLPVIALPEICLEARKSFAMTGSTAHVAAPRLTTSTSANQQLPVSHPPQDYERHIELQEVDRQSALMKAHMRDPRESQSRRTIWREKVLSTPETFYTSGFFKLLIFFTNVAPLGFFLTLMVLSTLPGYSSGTLVVFMAGASPASILISMFFWLLWVCLATVFGAL